MTELARDQLFQNERRGSLSVRLSLPSLLVLAAAGAETMAIMNAKVTAFGGGPAVDGERIESSSMQG
ncbi:MAG: hypothetical protein QNJ05_16035 [Woeseiaceae bacterium]|nr:hypothetical protein [Woeseiaceae bacterium]